MMEQSSKVFSRWAARLTAFLMVLVGVGFCLHTSIDTVVLGKYSKRYFVILCIWFFVLTPLVYWLARYLFSTQRVRLPSGRRSEEHTSELQSLRHLVCRL